MNDQIIAIYCICDDYLKARGFVERRWCNEKMSDAEVMTVMIVATRLFYGNIERARQFLYEYGYIPKILGKSRLNRRIHSISDTVWDGLIIFVHALTHHAEFDRDFLVDSFPVSVCRNIRISRCRIFQGETFRGYNASKQEFFYGLKVTLITNFAMMPIKMIIAPGSEHDLTALKVLDPSTLPSGSTIYCDAAYNDYQYEDILEKGGVKLIPDRRINSCRPHNFCNYVNLIRHRKTIETSFSQITGLFPKKIHAVLGRGFELKIIGFVLAAAINFCIN